jgi:hypothetical protein
VKVFLDECVDWRLARDIVGHDVETARQMGWTTIKNGTLLTFASECFDVFVTVVLTETQPRMGVLAVPLGAETQCGQGSSAVTAIILRAWLRMGTSVPI